MPNFQIRYHLQGSGVYSTEAFDINMAYKKMYNQFHEDNSLVVHANFAYTGFEIVGAWDVHGDLPKTPRYKVTTAEQKAKADAGELIEPPPEKPFKIANPDLFDFNYKPDDEKK